jgi:hypothetical protein
MNSPFGKSRGGTPMGERALQGARRTGRCGGFREQRSSAFRFPFSSYAFMSWLKALIVRMPVTTAGIL